MWRATKSVNALRRRAAEPSQRPVQRHHHARHRLIPQRQHDPKARPRQPRAKQHRRPPANLGRVAVIPLHPQPRLRIHGRYRRPCSCRQRASLPEPLMRRSLRPHIAHRDKRRATYPPRSSRASATPTPPPSRRTDRPSNANFAGHRQPTTSSIPSRYPMRDRLVITTSQPRRSSQRADQIERLQNLHDFLCFSSSPSPRRASMNTKRRELQATEDRTDVVGRSDGHPWGDPMAISGEFRWPPTGRSPWPPSRASRAAELPGNELVMRPTPTAPFSAYLRCFWLRSAPWSPSRCN